MVRKTTIRRQQKLGCSSFGGRQHLAERGANQEVVRGGHRTGAARVLDEQQTSTP